MSKNTLFIDVDTVKARTGLHFNVDEKLVQPEIKAAQDLHLEDALGTPLFKRLQAGIDADDLTPEEYELLNVYIADTLVYYTLMGLPLALTVQLYNKGAVRKIDADTAQVSMSDVHTVMNHYQQRAESYKERLIRYLQANASLYPKYLERGGCDSIKPVKSGYRCSFYLGD